MGYGLDDQGVGVQSRWEQEFSLLHIVQTGPGAHLASYPTVTVSLFPEDKAAVVGS
jgi:hypothetical protein